jgi:hypothetical protein
MKSLAFFIFGLLLISPKASAFSYANRGVGLAIGEPAGITVFYRTSDKAFVQAFIGPNMVLGGDYNFAFAGAIKDAPSVTPYLGFGGFIFNRDYRNRETDTSGFGIRMPSGLLFQIPEAPFQFHVEVSAASTINPFFYSFASAMVGLRFLF